MNRQPQLRRFRVAAAAVSAVAMVTAACGGDDSTKQEASPAAQAPASAVEIMATDYGFEAGPAKVAAGPVALTLANRGTENHHLTLLRVNDGTRVDDVLAGLRKGDLSVLARTSAVGGPNGVAPGAKVTVTADLSAGSYVMVCHIPSPQDSVSHAQKGMVGSFTVDGPTSAPAAAPAVSGTITIAKSGYQVPAGVGSGSYRFVNELDQPAEAALVRLRPGATAKDVMAFLGGQAPPGPPPFSSAGGITTLAPRASAVTTLDLPKGSYALLSFAPDLAGGGRPQFLSGLLTELTVS